MRTGGKKVSLKRDDLVRMFEGMLTIRRFEERVVELFARGALPGFVHLYIGEEAVAVGTCANLKDTDYITSTHRGHGHLIAKGGDLNRMMAELHGKKTGYCKGKGGSMHIADLELGILGANGIVGGGFPIAAGAAFAAQYKGTDAVCVCFFGDGASNQTTFHEALNLASIWKLPVVFVCENNMYGISMSQKRHQNIADVADRSSAYGIPGVTVDGNDVVAVYEATREAVGRARAGIGPSLVECKTYRWKGHFEGDPTNYRSQEELDEWKAKDPIKRLQEKLLDTKALTKLEIEKLDEQIRARVEAAVKFAEESPYPDVLETLDDVYTPVAS